MILKPNMSAIPTLGTWRAGSPGPKTAPAKPPAFGKPSGPLFTIVHENLSGMRGAGPGEENDGPAHPGITYQPALTPTYYWRPSEEWRKIPRARQECRGRS